MISLEVPLLNWLCCLVTGHSLVFTIFRMYLGDPQGNRMCKRFRGGQLFVTEASLLCGVHVPGRGGPKQSKVLGLACTGQTSGLLNIDPLLRISSTGQQ